MVEHAKRCFTLTWINLVNCASIAVSPPITRSISKVFEANSKGANKVNNIPEPFTKPACISADAGVGAVIADSNHLWNGNIADCISAAIMIHMADNAFK